MTPMLMGNARRFTDRQNLAVHKVIRTGICVAQDCFCTDHGSTGMNQAQPVLDHALHPLRQGETLVALKLTQPTGSAPKICAILEVAPSPILATCPAFPGRSAAAWRGRR